MFEGVFFDLILALAGGGIMTTGIVGLALGGRLPLLNIPERMRPMAKLGFTLAIVVGITLLLDKGHPDLLEQVVNELT